MLRHAPWIMLFGLTLACTGAISGTQAGGSSADTDGNGIPDGENPLPNAANDQGDARESLAPGKSLPDGVGVRALERLSRQEYVNTITDLLELGVEPTVTLPPDGLGPSGFELPGLVSNVEGRALQATAEAFAAEAARDLPKLMGCDPSADAACVTSFLSSFGRKAYRRPLEVDELSRLQKLYDVARQSHDARQAIRLVLEAVLQSPQFLYHWELGARAAKATNGVIALSSYEVASRLSYLLWSSLPDAGLLDAAERGELTTPDSLRSQFERLLSDARADRSLADFHAQWLSLQNLPASQKDAQTYPEFNPQLAQDMLVATQTFASDLVRVADGTFAELLTSPRVYVNASLAKLYGVSAPASDGLVAVDLDPAQRAGLLTQAAFLTAQASAIGSNPILRGKAVYERVACGITVAPPPDVPPAAPPSPELTTRERFAQHASNACAKACHEKFDPPGFAFESYDAIGRFRATENGRPVDASGVVELPFDGPKPFTNAVQLARLLSTSSDARQCIVRQWSRYALKRHEVAGELASLQGAYGAFQSSNFKLRELLRQLVTMKTFLYRLPSTGEVVQ